MLENKGFETIRIPGNGRRMGMEIFTNRILNYRYHWHESQYEITTVLTGRAIYSRGGETVELAADDVIIIEPLMGHASLSLESGTTTITLYFDSNAVAGLADAGSILSFSHWHSSEEDRYSHHFRLLRAIIADIMLSVLDDSPLSEQALDSHANLLLPCLMRYFGPAARPDSRRGDLSPIAASAVVDFLESHYQDKISLEDLSEFTGYNRTYLSTFFKTNTGLNFHEYLTRIRLKHSLSDLAYTDKPMTATALDNGFSDLKTFASIFKANFHITPSGYREIIKDAEKAESIESRTLEDPRSSMILDRLRAYSERGLVR